jgi:chorismate-pyruvate lyase
LSEFYEQWRLPLPAAAALPPGQIPQEYRRMLVHDRDMTPALEAVHGGPLRLRVLHHAVAGEELTRAVVLLANGGTPVAVGAIRIFLGRLPPAARNAALENRDPFGAILAEYGVAHRSRPSAYFKVVADSLIREALGIRASCGALFGRRNTIWNSVSEPLAEVAEILPPVRDGSHPGEKR